MICFNTTYLLLLLGLLVVVAIYYDYQHRKEIKQIKEGYQSELNKGCSCKNNDYVSNTSKKQSDNYVPQDIIQDETQLMQIPPIGPAPMLPISSVPPFPAMPPIIRTENIVREYDYANIRDELMRPSYRPSINVMGPGIIPPIHVRGPPDPSTWVGIVVNEAADEHDKNKILRVYGREKYHNSNNYEYYALIKTGSGKTKVKVERKDRKRDELYNGDEVTVPSLGEATYKFTRNPHDMLDYD